MVLHQESADGFQVILNGWYIRLFESFFSIVMPLIRMLRHLLANDFHVAWLVSGALSRPAQVWGRRNLWERRCCILETKFDLLVTHVPRILMSSSTIHLARFFSLGEEPCTGPRLEVSTISAVTPVANAGTCSTFVSKSVYSGQLQVPFYAPILAAQLLCRALICLVNLLHIL